VNACGLVLLLFRRQIAQFFEDLLLYRHERLSGDLDSLYAEGMRLRRIQLRVSDASRPSRQSLLLADFADTQGSATKL
jgi:hypothetical protein